MLTGVQVLLDLSNGFLAKQPLKKRGFGHAGRSPDILFFTKNRHFRSR
jgi:hypothetical protein